VTLRGGAVRGVDRTALLGASAVGAAVLAGCVVVGDDGPPYAFVRLGLLALLVGAACVVDEPAAAAVDAAPATLRRRTVERVAAAAIPLAVWALGVAGLEARNAVTPVAGLLVEGLGVLVVAVAASTALRAAGRTQPGDAVTAGFGGALLAVLVLDPPLQSLPLFPTGEAWAASTALWASLVGAAAVVAAVATREPYRVPR
jgi:hypothetical protein